MSRFVADARRFILPLGIALLGLVINSVVAVSMASTSDEVNHLDYGTLVLHGHPDRTDVRFDSKMPVSVLNALPRAAGAFLQRRQIAPRLAMWLAATRTARWGTIAAAFGLSLLVFVYAESLFGRMAGLFAQLLFVIDPNIIAHSTLTTTDLYFAGAAVLFLYRLRKFILSPGTGNTLWMSVTLGLAQLTKPTAVYLYVVLVVVMLAASGRWIRDPKWRRSIPVGKSAAVLALSAICSLAIINAGFVFDRSFTALSQYTFRSPLFQRIQQIPGLRSVPLPLPYAYIQGFDLLSLPKLQHGNIVLLNEVRGPDLPRGDPFPAYYLISYGLKEPLGMQLLLLLALIWVFRNRRAGFPAGEGILLAAATVFLIALSLARTQIGIRLALPVLAIFAILSGAAFSGWATFSLRRKLLLSGCLLYTVVSVATWFPDMIPYFNEILTDRKSAYRYLADSNLDWGQDKFVVNRFIKDNPDVALNPRQRVPGRVLVGANAVAGVWPPAADYWVRVEGLKPVAQVGYSHLLFLVPPRPSSAVGVGR